MNQYSILKLNIAGFSLVELMVVISVIAILSGVIGFSVSDTRQQGRDAERQSDLLVIKASIEEYKRANGQYPAMGCTPLVAGWSRQSDCYDFVSGLATVLSQIPRDPSPGSGDGYVYRTNPAGTVFKLMARGSVEQTVTSDHSLQACDATLCGTTCTGASAYSSSFAVWGGFASADLDDTRAVICAM